MKIQEQPYGAVTVLTPDGPLTAPDVEQFKARVTEVLKDKLGRVVLDASAIAFVDSRGLESLLDITRQIAESGRSLKLCAVNETVRQVLELTGLSPQFEHFEDAKSAVRSFL